MVASRLGLYVLLLSPGTDLTRSIASSAGPRLSRFGVTHGENLSPCPLLSLSSTVRWSFLNKDPAAVRMGAFAAKSDAAARRALSTVRFGSSGRSEIRRPGCWDLHSATVAAQGDVPKSIHELSLRCRGACI